MWERGLADGAEAMTRAVTEEARAAGERMLTEFGLVVESFSLAHQGKVAAARAKVKEAHETSMGMGGFHEDTVYAISAYAALAAGDADDAKAACELATDAHRSQPIAVRERHHSDDRGTTGVWRTGRRAPVGG